MTARGSRLVAVLAAAVLLVLGLRPLGAADEPYDLYVITSLTGQAAFLGRDEAPAIAGFEKYVNAHGGIRGRPIHFVILDDTSNAATAVQLANQVIAKGVPAIVGPTLGATCGSVEPLIDAGGPLQYCLSSVGRPTPGGYGFLCNINNRDQEANGFRYLKAKGVRKLALLETTDASGADSEAAAQEALKDPDLRDLQIVDIEHYAPSDLSVAAQLARIKASGADAISNYVTGTAFGTGLRGIYEAGFGGYVFTAVSNASRDQMKQYVPFLPDKLVFGTLGYQMTGGVPKGVLDAKAVYRAAMREVGITEPSVGNLIVWDPLMMIVAGLRRYGPGATAAQLRDAVLQLHDWAGIMGTYDFRRGDQRGLDPKSSGAMRYDKASGDFVVLSKPGGAPL